MFRALKIAWSLLWNLVQFALFGAMLASASTSFETIVISGLGIIYVAIVSYATVILRTQFAQSRQSTHQFIRIAKIVGDESTQEEMSELNKVTETQWLEFQRGNVFWYINMALLLIIWATAVVSIVIAVGEGG